MVKFEPPRSPEQASIRLLPGLQRVEIEGGRVVKGTGDGFLIVFDGSAYAIGCAETICAEADELGIQVRAGIHSGECELMGHDLAGLGVHIGARVCALAGPGEVWVSSTVRDLVAGSDIGFSDRGAHRLKGVPGDWQLFAVQGAGPERDAGRLQRSARNHLTRRDRIAVHLAGRAPGVARAATRMIRRRPRRRSLRQRRAPA